MAKRRCKGKTKTGRTCKAAALRGDDRCIAHTRNHEVSQSFGGPQPGSGRPRNPKPSEEVRRLVEGNARAIVRPFFRTLGLELHEDGTMSACQGAVICAKHEGEVHASDVEDLGAKITAAEKLLDRVYGKPRVAVEVFGAEDGAAIAIDALGLNLAALSDKELEVLQKLAERSEEG